ncbi:MAG: DUF1236 domain-containing protein [Beijerinckiaceae bacterium]|nr:DUF1236 domain-containing protein [Beijerinckiaceae bacterium]MCI0735992.1 DUF1236 domain-containing protein [Beijerinckiaceae bacterium]
MRKIQIICAVAALAGLFALPVMAQVQGGPGAQEGSEAAGSRGAAIGGAAGLLSAGQRPRFREYAMRQHRPSPYSLREPVTAGTLLPPAGITLYEIPREYGVAPEYRYAVVNNLVLLVDPVTHQIVEVID